jgi:hypothetical protein
MSDIPDIIRQKNIFVGLILLLFSELKREQKKAEKKDRIKVESTLLLLILF